jgi:hypothetical protein
MTSRVGIQFAVTDFLDHISCNAIDFRLCISLLSLALLLLQVGRSPTSRACHRNCRVFNNFLYHQQHMAVSALNCENKCEILSLKYSSFSATSTPCPGVILTAIKPVFNHLKTTIKLNYI